MQKFIYLLFYLYLPVINHSQALEFFIIFYFTNFCFILGLTVKKTLITIERITQNAKFATQMKLEWCSCLAAILWRVLDVLSHLQHAPYVVKKWLQLFVSSCLNKFFLILQLKTHSISSHFFNLLNILYFVY